MPGLGLGISAVTADAIGGGFSPALIDDLFFGIDNKNLNTVIKLLIYTKGNIMVSAPNIYKDILEKISINNSEIELINAGEF